MTREELRKAAIECLGKAFKTQASDPVPPSHVLQAAVSVLLAPDPAQT
jgi:hypothetical protein